MQIEKVLLEKLNALGKTLATAESCTGGLIGKLMTDIRGSSAVYLGGIISYSNEVKHKVLSVPQELLDTYGAVSSSVAQAMAEGARNIIGADIAVSVTGIAGPNSDNTKKPVGLVFICYTDGIKTVVQEHHFHGNREQIRKQSADAAMSLILQMLS